MANERFNTENTRGFTASEVEQMNNLYNARVAELSEEDRANVDYLQQIAEEIEYHYMEIADSIIIRFGMAVEVRKYRLVRTEDDDTVVIALVDLDHGNLPGIVCVIYEDWTVIAQNDLQSPNDAIPDHLDDIWWPNHVVICEDGLPRYLPGEW